MTAIPIEKTLTGAYQFFFRNLLSVIGIVWFPFALMLASCALLFLAAVPAEWFQGKFDFTPVIALRLFGAYFALIFVYLFLAAMMNAGLVRRALDMPSGQTLFYFSLATPVWRLFGAYLLLVLTWFGVVIGIAVVIGLGDLLGQRTNDAARVLVDIVTVCGGFVALIYCMVRLSFFLPAVVIAEERVSFGRSWRLGGGNFWRAVLISLLVTFPVQFAAGTIMQVLLLMPGVIPALPHNFSDNTPMTPAEFWQFLHGMLPVFVPLQIAVILIEVAAITGINAGAIAIAYRAVSGQPLPQTPLPQTPLPQSGI